MEKGAVLTATELEGCDPAADWSRWIRDGRAPAPPAGGTFADSWPEDIEQLAGLGIDAVQITLEWAGLEPRLGTHDTEVVEYRRDLLAAARRQGLTVWACLVDGALPGWFAEDEGGFIDDRSRHLLWPRHIDWVGEHFGDLVDGWIPQREPLTWALRRYLRAEAPPGRRDEAMAAEAVRAAMLADGEAWRLLRGTAPVAAFHTARPIRAARALSGIEDVKAVPRARTVERLLWHPWVSALAEGKVVAGDLPIREVNELRGAFDRVVVQLRPPIEVGASGGWAKRQGEVASMAEMLRRVADELPNHEIVAAGDLAEVADDGRARPDHVQAVLDATAEAAAETSVVGWWQTSPIDGYHWGRGVRAEPGLIGRDRHESDAAKAFRDWVG